MVHVLAVMHSLGGDGAIMAAAQRIGACAEARHLTDGLSRERFRIMIHSTHLLFDQPRLVPRNVQYYLTRIPDTPTTKHTIRKNAMLPHALAQPI